MDHFSTQLCFLVLSKFLKFIDPCLKCFLRNINDLFVCRSKSKKKSIIRETEVRDCWMFFDILQIVKYIFLILKINWLKIN